MDQLEQVLPAVLLPPDVLHTYLAGQLQSKQRTSNSNSNNARLASVQLPLLKATVEHGHDAAIASHKVTGDQRLKLTTSLYQLLLAGEQEGAPSRKQLRALVQKAAAAAEQQEQQQQQQQQQQLNPAAVGDADSQQAPVQLYFTDASLLAVFGPHRPFPALGQLSLLDSIKLCEYLALKAYGQSAGYKPLPMRGDWLVLPDNSGQQRAARGGSSTQAAAAAAAATAAAAAAAAAAADARIPVTSEPSRRIVFGQLLQDWAPGSQTATVKLYRVQREYGQESRVQMAGEQALSFKEVRHRPVTVMSAACVSSLLSGHAGGAWDACYFCTSCCLLSRG
jgi:hypothetical protein